MVVVNVHKQSDKAPAEAVLNRLENVIRQASDCQRSVGNLNGSLEIVSVVKLKVLRTIG